MYCIKCGKENHVTSGECKYCHEELVSHELNYEETRTLNKSLHNRLNVSREHVDNAMVLVVVGATLLIIGFLFFFLSFKLPSASAHNKVITVTCFEFWVSMAGLGVGGIMLIIGLIRLIKEKAVIQREIMRALKAVQYGTYDHLAEYSLGNSKK